MTKRVLITGVSSSVVWRKLVCLEKGYQVYEIGSGADQLPGEFHFLQLDPTDLTPIFDWCPEGCCVLCNTAGVLDDC